MRTRKSHVDQNDNFDKFTFSVRTETAEALPVDPFGLASIQLEVSRDNWLVAAATRSSDANFL